MTHYDVYIPKTEGYSVVAFIQAPNSEPGANCTLVHADLVDEQPDVVGELIGEMISKSLQILRKNPTVFEKPSKHRFSRFYAVSGDKKLESGNAGFVQWETKDDS